MRESPASVSSVELRHLRSFVAVAGLGNISAAARQLRLSQPTLSRQIRDLEQAIGRPLFVRQSTGLTLTATGAALKEDSVKALANIDDAIAKTRASMESARQVLRIGYYGTVSIWASLVAPALDKLDRKFPEVACQVVELPCGKLMQELNEGRLDAAVLGPGEYQPASGVRLEVACTVPGMVLLPANHRLAKKRLLSIDDLREEPVVSVTEELWPGRDLAFVAACEAAGFSPKINRESSSLPEAIMALKKVMGVGILGAFATTTPHPGMAFIKLKAPGVPLKIYVARRESSAHADDLAQFLLTEAQRASKAFA